MNIQSKIHLIHKIPPELFDQGYWYFSFDVTLFTNIPLIETINILESIYKEKPVNTELRKKTSKKLKDCCTKTAFSFNGIICKQKAGVFMGSLLSPVLANIIMTESERVIVEPLIGFGKIH